MALIPGKSQKFLLMMLGIVVGLLGLLSYPASSEEAVPKQIFLSTKNPFHDGQPAQLFSSSEPFYLMSGDTMKISINREKAGTVSFLEKDFVLMDSATAEEVAEVIGKSGIPNLTVQAFNGKVVLKTARHGSRQSIQLLDGKGTPAAAMGFRMRWAEGKDLQVSEATPINRLSDQIEDYFEGDQLRILGKRFNGAPIVESFLYGSSHDGTTMGDLVRHLQQIVQRDGTVQISPDGNILIRPLPGKILNGLNLFITDGEGNHGKSRWDRHWFESRSQ